MTKLQEYVEHFDPMRDDNERYVPEDQATLQYSKISVMADEKWVGASLQPNHTSIADLGSNPFVNQIRQDYIHSEKLEVSIDCYEHEGNEVKRGLLDGEFSLFCMGALDLTVVSSEKTNLSYHDEQEIEADKNQDQPAEEGQISLC